LRGDLRAEALTAGAAVAPRRALRDNAPVRALTVIQLVPRLESGGAERSTLEIADALVRGGHRSIVVSGGGRLVPRLVAAGSDHVELPIGAKSLATLALVPRLRGLFGEARADVVHARSRLPAWLAWRALARMHRPPHFVTTVHGRNSPGWYSSIMTRGARVICVSGSLRSYVLAHWPRVPADRLVVIPRGIDAAAFPRAHAPDAAWRARFAAEFPALDALPLVVLPGRGTRLKGHVDAIRALAALERVHGVRAGLLLLGAREPGRERYVAELEDRARALGVADRVAIAPPRDDVRDVYSRAHVVLQLSNPAESFGRTVVEALSIGRPVVGYAHGGVGESLAALFPQGAVAPGDVDAVAARIAAMLVAPPDVAPIDGYRLEDMQRATLDVYQAVAAEPRA
jgi:glycosyltransferase involved in cell wall biosynthesis